MQTIDLLRFQTYKIYDLPELLKQCAFTRNSNFKYTTKKGRNNQPTKTYVPKWAELKVEQYRGEQQRQEGRRIGHVKLNLSQFINKGI